MDDKNNSQDPQSPQPYDPSRSPEPNQSSDYPAQDYQSHQQYNQHQAVDPYEPVESTAPVSQSSANSQQEQPSATAPNQPRKKRWLIVIAIIIAALLAGLAALYFLWYQNPNKVVSDSIMNAIQAKNVSYTGNLTTTGDTNVKIDFRGANVAEAGRLGADVTFDFANESYTLAADAIVDDKADIYFKVKEIDALAENYRSTVPPESQELLDQLIDKVNDKWIKVGAAELRNFSQDAAQAQKCIREAVKKVQEDKQVKAQLIDLYKSHPFITIKDELGSKDGSLGYRLVPNEEASTGFSKGLRDTDIYRFLNKCDPSFTISDDDLVTSDDSGEPVEIWVDRWSHSITKLSVDSNEDGTSGKLVFEPDFNQDITIETPTDATTLQQLQQDVQALIQSSAAPQQP